MRLHLAFRVLPERQKPPDEFLIRAGWLLLQQLIHERRCAFWNCIKPPLQGYAYNLLKLKVFLNSPHLHPLQKIGFDKNCCLIFLIRIRHLGLLQANGWKFHLEGLSILMHTQGVSNTDILPQRKTRNGKEMFQANISTDLAKRVRIAAAEMGVRTNILTEAALTSFLDANAPQPATEAKANTAAA
jgi:hypothetical protein